LNVWHEGQLTNIQISISSGVITTYSSTIIKTFGYSSRVSALLNMSSGVFSIISILAVGYGVRFRSHRWAWLVACCVPGIIGGGLMSFAPGSNRAALLAGIYLINAITATLIILYQWTIANVAGHTKRVVASALIAGSFSVGNIIGPQTFQAKDAPGYRPAKIIVMATQSAGAFVTVLLFAYYIWANREKDKKHGQASDSKSVGVEDAWGNLTDKENAKFRYVY
jgi:MFS family permease